MKQINDQILSLIRTQFGRIRGTTRSELSTLFFSICEMVRQGDPEGFHNLFATIGSREDQQSFHKRLRQVDCSSLAGADVALYYCLDLFETAEWEQFDILCQELIRYNNTP